MAQITKSSLIALKDALTEDFFKVGIFTDDNQSFLVSDEFDRFVRPYDPLPLGEFDQLITPNSPESYRTRGFFPAVGTSWDQKFLYYGLRVPGSGSAGVDEAALIWPTLKAIENVESVLDDAFGESWESLGECWIGFSYLTDVPVRGHIDKATISKVANKLAIFTLRLSGSTSTDA
jgi:hypothetical protein